MKSTRELLIKDINKLEETLLLIINNPQNSQNYSSEVDILFKRIKYYVF